MGEDGGTLDGEREVNIGVVLMMEHLQVIGEGFIKVLREKISCQTT